MRTMLCICTYMYIYVCICIYIYIHILHAHIQCVCMNSLVHGHVLGVFNQTCSIKQIREHICTHITKHTKIHTCQPSPTGPNRALFTRARDEKHHQIAAARGLHGLRRVHHRLPVPSRCIQVHFWVPRVLVRCAVHAHRYASILHQ